MREHISTVNGVAVSTTHARRNVYSWHGVSCVKLVRLSAARSIPHPQLHSLAGLRLFVCIVRGVYIFRFGIRAGDILTLICFCTRIYVPCVSFPVSCSARSDQMLPCGLLQKWKWLQKRFLGNGLLHDAPSSSEELRSCRQFHFMSTVLR